MEEENNNPPLNVLYNSAYHLHRVSPLYHRGISSRSFLSNEPIRPRGVRRRSIPAQANKEEEEEEGVLDVHARRFEEILRGDVIRGVQIGRNLDRPEDNDDDEGMDDEGEGEGEGEAAVLGRAGRLTGCRWRTYSDSRDDDDEQRQRRRRRRRRDGDEPRYGGVVIDVMYERMTYSAVLLGLYRISSSSRLERRPRSRPNRSPLFVVDGVAGDEHGRDRRDDNDDDDDEDEDGEFSTLPLLLIRMPRSLKRVLMEYLSTTFDTRISYLRFDSGGMAALLEGYLTAITSSVPDATQHLPPPPRHINGHRIPVGKPYHRRKISPEKQESRITTLVRDVQLTLSFPAAIASPMLKSLDVTIPRKDVIGFWKRGKQLAADSATQVSVTSATRTSVAGPSRSRRDGMTLDAQHGPQKKGSDERKDGGDDGTGFMAAISEYLMTHLAFTQPLLPSSRSDHGKQSVNRMDINVHEDDDDDEGDDGDDDEGNRGDETGSLKRGIVIAKIVCGGFSVWAEGRVKILASSSISTSHARMRRHSRDEDEVIIDDEDEDEDEEEDMEAARDFAREELIRGLIQGAESQYILRYSSTL